MSAPNRPLSDTELGVILDRAGVTEQGRALIHQIRTSPPARSVSGGGVSVTGRYPSRKMRVTVQFESGGPEFAFIIICERDPATHEYYDQPTTLTLRYEVETDKGPRLVVVSTTPDFFVLSDDRPAFVECKTEEELEKLLADPNSRYVRDGDRVRCPAGEEAARYYGCDYVVWTPKSLSRAFVDNVRLLDAEWGRSARTFPDEVVNRIVAKVRDVPGVSLAELVHVVGDPDPVHWAIFHGHIHVDFAATFLTYTDQVRLFIDADAAAAWKAAVESIPEALPGVASQEVLANARLALFPREALKVAVERYKAIRPAIDGDLPACKLPRRQRRWLLAFRKAQRQGGVGLVGLCPKSHLQGNRGSRIHPRTEELMEEVAETEYETATNLTGRAAYALLMGRCQDEGAPCISYITWLRYLAKRDRIHATRKRKGRKQAESDAPARRPTGPDVHGQAPLDTVHIDETTLDLLVRVGHGPGAFLLRPNLSIAYCSWSELVLGHDLFFDPPSIASAFMTLRDLYERHGRFPNRLVLDRGPWFGSTALDELCAAAFIQKVQRPPGHPKFGTKVERMLRTTNFQVVHLMAGNTQLLKDPRRLTPEVDPARQAVWRLDELDRVLTEFLYERYPNQPHKGLGMMTPLERYEQGKALMGTGHVPEANPELRFLLWPPAKRETAKVNGRTGIVVEGIRYWHHDMRSDGVRGTRVPVRIDPHDAGHVVAFVKGRWVQCHSERYVEVQGLSKRELRIASIAVRARRPDSQKRRSVRLEEMLAMLREIRKTEAGLREAMRREERDKVLDRRGLRLASLDSDTPSQPASGESWQPRDLDDFEPGTQL